MRSKPGHDPLGELPTFCEQACFSEFPVAMLNRFRSDLLGEPLPPLDLHLKRIGSL
jgi:hypothetical protein